MTIFLCKIMGNYIYIYIYNLFRCHLRHDIFPRVNFRLTLQLLLHPFGNVKELLTLTYFNDRLGVIVMSVGEENPEIMYPQLNHPWHQKVIHYCALRQEVRSLVRRFVCARFFCSQLIVSVHSLPPSSRHH